jgi:2-C-methyl-D-erythritol 4-phosphate cytidylyltransferase
MVSLDLVLVHDIARPFIKSTLIEQLCNAAREFGCAVPGVKLKDTIKKVTDDFVNHTLDRNQLYAIQTPQACLTKIINDAHHLAQINRFLGTDEASLVETFNLSPVKVVLGDYDNIKLTTPEDIQYAHTLFNKYF